MAHVHLEPAQGNNSRFTRTAADWALRCLDLAEEALEQGLTGSARLCLAAALSFAEDVARATLRQMLLAEWTRLFGAWAVLSAEAS